MLHLWVVVLFANEAVPLNVDDFAILLVHLGAGVVVQDVEIGYVTEQTSLVRLTLEALF